MCPQLPCRHRFCRECVAAYVENKIADNLLSMTCPDLVPASDGADGGGGGGGGDVGCPMEISEAVMFELLSAGGKAKYDRFAAMRANQQLRQCPADSCGALVRPERSAFLRRVQPELSCPDCGLGFCYYHSAAHPGQSCRQYELAQREQQRADERAIAALTKPCPGCKTPTEKNSGCNHMTCSNAAAGCRQDWCVVQGSNSGTLCPPRLPSHTVRSRVGASLDQPHPTPPRRCWICGRKIGGGSYPNHYAWWNVFGCPGTQMAERYAEFGRLKQCGFRLGICAWRIVALPLAVLVLALALSLAALVLALSPSLLISFPILACGAGGPCQALEDLREDTGLLLLAATWPLWVALAAAAAAAGLGLLLCCVAVAVPGGLVGWPVVALAAAIAGHQLPGLTRNPCTDEEHRFLWLCICCWPVAPVVLALGLPLACCLFPIMYVSMPTD
eukprot:SAG22_NODE_8_length_37215_cov_120.960351_7_plen_445_part_00